MKHPVNTSLQNARYYQRQYERVAQELAERDRCYDALRKENDLLRRSRDDAWLFAQAVLKTGRRAD